MDSDKLKEQHEEGTKPSLRSDWTEAELQRKLQFPKDAQELKEAQEQLERMSVTFSGQLNKAFVQLKQLDMEMMENFNIVLASIPQTNLVPHALASIEGLKARREELFKFIRLISGEINANKDASRANVPIDSHYL